MRGGNIYAFFSLKNSKFKIAFITLIILFAIIAGLLIASSIYRSSYDNKIVFEYESEDEDYKWEYSFDKLNIKYLIDETMEEVMKDWQALHIIDALADMFGIVPYEEEKSIVSEIEKEKTINVLENINKELKLNPEDARFYLDKENNELEIIESTNGKAVNIDKTFEKVKELIKYDYGLFLEDNQANISLVVEEKSPETTTSDIEGKEIETIVSSFYTEFDKEQEGRTHNINLASEYFYNLMVEPEEVISFNEIIDDLRQKDKLRKAPIIVEQEFVDGVGGGLCQVSSTLYNTALKAGLNILERHNHSRPVSYLPLGRDAAVAEQYLDLKVQNPYDNHILIFSYTEGNRLYFKIFGHEKYENLDEQYEIVTADYEEKSPPKEYVKAENSDDCNEDDEQIKQGGSPGYQISTWRYKEDELGNIVDRQFLYTDNYATIPTIIEICKNKTKE